MSGQSVGTEGLEPRTARPIRIVFFGDSICVGQGVSIHKGWVTRLSAQVSDRSKRLNREYVVMNSSVNGNTTRQALERMPYDVQSHGVDLLIAQFGMNDCNFWESDRGMPRVSPRAFKANLHEIVDRAHIFGAQRVILNTNHPTARFNDLMADGTTTYQESNAAYSRIIRAVAAEHQVAVLNDVERVFLEHLSHADEAIDDLLLDDRLHLSERGHDLYFASCAPVVEKELIRVEEFLAGMD